MEPMHQLFRGFTLVDEAETSDGRVVTLRTLNGVTVVCRIPCHTAAEQTALCADICAALLRFSDPAGNGFSAGRIENFI